MFLTLDLPAARMMAVADRRHDPRTERVDGISLEAHWP